VGCYCYFLQIQGRAYSRSVAADPDYETRGHVTALPPWTLRYYGYLLLLHRCLLMLLLMP